MHVIKDNNVLVEKINKRFDKLDTRVDVIDNKLNDIINIGKNTQENTYSIKKDISEQMFELRNFTNTFKQQLSTQRNIIYFGSFIIAIFLLFIIINI